MKTRYTRHTFKQADGQGAKLRNPRQSPWVTVSVSSAVLLFSLPYLLSYFLQTLYGMADLWMIGRYCDVASTTAVSVGGQVMYMLTVILVGLSMGTTVLTGQAVGAGERERLRAVVRNTVYLFVSLSLALTLALQLAMPKLLELILTPPAALPETHSYLRICFWGIPLICAYNLISAILRGMGDAKSPLYFIALACAVNVGLDYWFIGPLAMGAAGAALATVLAQGLSVGAALLLLYRRRLSKRAAAPQSAQSIQQSRNAAKQSSALSGQMVYGCRTLDKEFRVSFRAPMKQLIQPPERAVISRLLSIGLPVACQDGLIQVAFIIITVIANQRGLEDAAAVGIVEKLIGLMFLVPSSLLQTVSVLSAHNLGAGKPERAQKTLGFALVLALLWGSIVSILMQFLAEASVARFTKDAAVALMGAAYLRGYVWDCILAGVHFCFSGYFCAVGRSQLSFLHNFISIVCARVPLAYLASAAFPDSLYPMGLATAAGSALSVFICLILYRSMRLNQLRKEGQAAVRRTDC